MAKGNKNLYLSLSKKGFVYYREHGYTLNNST